MRITISCAIAFVLFAVALLNGTTLLADEVVPPASTQSSIVEPELATKWREGLRGAKRISGTAIQSDFNLTFEVETRRNCEFIIERPDRWRVELTPVDVRGQQSSRRNKSGTLYSLETSAAEIWIRDGEQLIFADADSKTITKIPVSGSYIRKVEAPFFWIFDPTDYKDLVELSEFRMRAGQFRIFVMPIVIADATRPENFMIWKVAPPFAKGACDIDPTNFRPTKVLVRFDETSLSIYSIQSLEILSEEEFRENASNLPAIDSLPAGYRDVEVR